MATKIEHGGETTYDCGAGYEVHPGHQGGWVVVGPSGQVECHHAELDDAISQAEALAELTTEE